MKRDNHNKAITLVSPTATIPVLIPFTGKGDGVVYETSSANPPLTSSYPVAVISMDALKKVIESPKYFSPSFRRQLVLDLQLADLLEQGNRKRAQALVSGEPLSEQIVGAGGKIRLKPEKLEGVLARHIVDSISKTQFVVWLDERVGKLRPGLVCGNEREAVYALLLERLGRPGNWSLCKRCGALFQKRRASQPYCSARCRINDAMKRYRERRARLQRGKRRPKR